MKITKETKIKEILPEGYETIDEHEGEFNQEDLGEIMISIIKKTTKPVKSRDDSEIGRFDKTGCLVFACVILTIAGLLLYFSYRIFGNINEAEQILNQI